MLAIAVGAVACICKIARYKYIRAVEYIQLFHCLCQQQASAHEQWDDDAEVEKGELHKGSMTPSKYCRNKFS